MPELLILVKLKTPIEVQRNQEIIKIVFNSEPILQETKDTVTVEKKTKKMLNLLLIQGR